MVSKREWFIFTDRHECIVLGKENLQNSVYELTIINFKCMFFFFHHFYNLKGTASVSSCPQHQTSRKVGWLVGCFGFNGPLRQYFSLYRAISQRAGERRERIDESKNVKSTPPAPTASATGPFPTVIEIVGRPGAGSLPPPFQKRSSLKGND